MADETFEPQVHNEGLGEGSRSETQVHGGHQNHGGHSGHDGHGVHAQESGNTESADHNHPAAANGATININQSGQNWAANNSPTSGAQPRGNHEHPQSAFAGSVGTRANSHWHTHSTTHDQGGAGVAGHGGHGGHSGHNEHGANDHGDHGGKPRLRVHFIIKT